MRMTLSQQSRINITELKTQIAKKLGPDRSLRYFSYIKRLLGHKLSKKEFDKHCLSILGRENVPLHNQLVLSILKNAFQAKTMPSFGHVKFAPNPVGSIFKKKTQDYSVLNQLGASVWSNGDILPPSPHKARSNTREQRIEDRPSPLGPNGRVDASLSRSLLPMNEKVIKENGTFSSCDSERSMQQHQGLPSQQLEKRTRIDNLASHDQASLQDTGGDVVIIAGDEEVYQTIKQSPLQAPLGIPFCPVSTSGVQKSFSSVSSSYVDSVSSNHDNRELCDSESLKKIMEKVAVAQGLEGVTTECSDLLNKALDAYLKRLIASCYDLIRVRQSCRSDNNPVLQHEHQSNAINGIWLGTHMHSQNSAGPLDCTQGMRNQRSITLQDFTIAMELNPQQLGEDWPLLLEKRQFTSEDLLRQWKNYHHKDKQKGSDSPFFYIC